MATACRSTRRPRAGPSRARSRAAHPDRTSSSDPACPDGTSPGAPFAVEPGGVLEQIAADPRTYEVASPAPSGGTVSVTATGPPGDLVVSLVGDDPAGLFQPLHLGVLLVEPPLQVTVLGTIPAGGELQASVPVPPLPPLLPFATTYRQGLFLGPGGEGFLGSASVVVVLP